MAEAGRFGVFALPAVGLVAAPAGAQDEGRARVHGAVDGRVTQETIQRTICQRGYTASVLPPRVFTDAAKRRLMNGHGGSRSDYELDHLIPIGLGGHPTSSSNLWLQPWPAAAMKDRDELRLHRDVCAGRMTLDEAQREMLAVWGPR